MATYFTSILLKKALTYPHRSPGSFIGPIPCAALSSTFIPSKRLFIPGLPELPVGGKSYTDGKKRKMEKMVLAHVTSFSTVLEP